MGAETLGCQDGASYHGVEGRSHHALQSYCIEHCPIHWFRTSSENDTESFKHVKAVPETIYAPLVAVTLLSLIMPGETPTGFKTIEPLSILEPKTDRSRLLTLPYEVRIKIHRYVFTQQMLICRAVRPRWRTRHLDRPPFPLHQLTCYLQTCRRLYHEASPLMYAHAELYIWEGIPNEPWFDDQTWRRGIANFENVCVHAMHLTQLKTFKLDWFPRLKHMTIDLGVRRSWQGMGILFNKPMDEVTWAHPGADRVVESTPTWVLKPRVKVMMEVMVCMKKLHQQASNDAFGPTVALKGVTQAYGPILNIGTYPRIDFKLSLNARGEFKLWYMYKDVEYDVVQRPLTT